MLGVESESRTFTLSYSNLKVPMTRGGGRGVHPLYTVRVWRTIPPPLLSPPPPPPAPSLRGVMGAQSQPFLYSKKGQKGTEKDLGIQTECFKEVDFRIHVSR